MSGGRLSTSMRRFSEVIDDLELKDIPLLGGLLRGGEEVIIAQCLDLIVFHFRRTGRAFSIVLFS